MSESEDDSVAFFAGKLAGALARRYGVAGFIEGYAEAVGPIGPSQHVHLPPPTVFDVASKVMAFFPLIKEVVDGFVRRSDPPVTQTTPAPGYGYGYAPYSSMYGGYASCDPFGPPSGIPMGRPFHNSPVSADEIVDQMTRRATAAAQQESLRQAQAAACCAPAAGFNPVNPEQPVGAPDGRPGLADIVVEILMRVASMYGITGASTVETDPSEPPAPTSPVETQAAAPMMPPQAPTSGRQ